MWLKKIARHKYPLLLIVIAVITHQVWFLPHTKLTYSDWYWWPQTAVNELSDSWQAWIQEYWGLGTPNIQIYFKIFLFFWSSLGRLGIPFEMAEKINLFIPIAILGFISPYYLAKKLSLDDLGSFISSLYYGSNTYFLTIQTSHIPLAFVNALAPLVILTFIVTLERNTWRWWAFFALFFSYVANHEVRIGYLLVVMLAVYFFLYQLKSLRNYFLNGFMFILVFIFVNAFWLLPIIGNPIGETLGSIAGRGLFGNNLYDLAHSFTLMHWGWTGGYPNQFFQVQEIKWHFWIGLLTVFIPTLFLKAELRKKSVFFFALSVLGLLLSKQVAPPLQNLYPWLYSHFPGFNLFREASKFYLFVSIGYFGLLVLGLASIKGRFRTLVSIIIIFVSFLNLWPAFTRQIRTLFVARNIPNDYTIANNFIANQSEFFRTLSLPRYSKWGYFSLLHPRILLDENIQTNWVKLANRLNLKPNTPLEEKMFGLLRLDFADNLLDQSSIKYLIVPVLDDENDDDFYMYYGNSQSRFTHELSQLSYLSQIDIGTSELAIFENANYKPHLYLTASEENIEHPVTYETVKHTQISPVKYLLHLDQTSSEKHLLFSETFHSGWKLYKGDLNWPTILVNATMPLPVNHVTTQAGLNSFSLPSQLEPGYYTLYYQPQVLAEVGSLLSLLSTGVVVLYIVSPKT